MSIVLSLPHVGYLKGIRSGDVVLTYVHIYGVEKFKSRNERQMRVVRNWTFFQIKHDKFAYIKNIFLLIIVRIYIPIIVSYKLRDIYC